MGCLEQEKDALHGSGVGDLGYGATRSSVQEVPAAAPCTFPNPTRPFASSERAHLMNIETHAHTHTKGTIIVKEWGSSVSHWCQCDGPYVQEQARAWVGFGPPLHARI